MEHQNVSERIEHAAATPVDRDAWRGVDVLDLMQEGVFVVSHDFRFLYVNRAAAQIGRSTKQALLNGKLLDLYPGLEKTPIGQGLTRCLAQRASQVVESEFTFPNGSSGYFELHFEPVPEGALVLSVEVTQRRELEAQLALTQKMDALGRLAGGIAHDFNNILTVIVHTSELVARALPADDPNQSDLREIMNVTDRGAKMVRQLLALSRKQPGHARPLSVNESLSEIMPILRRLVSDSVSIELTPEPSNAAIRIDQNHLTQLMLSLVANARDAILSRGCIWITCASIEAAEAQQLLRTRAGSLGDVESSAPANDYVRISVSDDGCGMDKATQARIFEPFFTTKEPTRGRGLGLAAAHGIVKQNDGEIRVVSAPQQGTTMELYFPRVANDVEPRKPRTELFDVRGGTEVVLVVDDEPSIRALCARTLSKLGYTVMQVESASEALRFVSRYTGQIDLVISDVAMPEMSGEQLCRQLTAARPKLRTLLMSGYVDEARHPDIDLSQVLSKPFTQADLARRVRETLDAHS